MDPPSTGVEEEFLLVEPGTGQAPARWPPLIDPRTGRPGGAAAVTALLLAHVRDALADVGDLGTVTGLLTEVLRRRSGAAFQREAFRRTGRLRDVVASAAEAVRG